MFTLPEPLIGDSGARDHVLARRHRQDVEVRPVGHEPDQPHRRQRHDRAEGPEAKTDAEPLPDSFAALAGRAEARNLVTIYAELADETPDQTLLRFAGQGFGAFKPALAELLVESLRPIKQRFDELSGGSAELDSILQGRRGEGESSRSSRRSTPLIMPWGCGEPPETPRGAASARRILMDRRAIHSVP